MAFRCSICGEIVEKSERTSHLLDWLIPKHAEWFVTSGSTGAVYKGADGKARYNKNVIRRDRRGKEIVTKIRGGKPHLSYGSTVSEYFTEV